MASLLKRSCFSFNNVFHKNFNSLGTISRSHFANNKAIKTAITLPERYSGITSLKSLFHTSHAAQAPILLPPLLIKGAYHVTRLGISLSPFIYKSRVFRNYPKTTKIVLGSLVIVGGLVLISSIDRNPYTGRLRLLLQDKETSAYCEEQDLSAMIINSPLSEALEKMWGGISLEILEKLVKNSDLDIGELLLKAQFTHDKEIRLIFSRQGVLYISRGFLDFVKGDSMLLAAGISHLLAHLCCEHSSEAFGKSAFFSICLDVVRSALYLTLGHLAFLSDVVAVSVTQLQTHALESPFKEKLETEANVISLHLMARAGFDPNHVIKFWEKMLVTSQEIADKNRKNYDASSPLPKKLYQIWDHIKDSFEEHTGFYSLHPCSNDSLDEIRKAIGPAMTVLKLPVKQTTSKYLFDCPYLKESLSQS